MCPTSTSQGHFYLESSRLMGIATIQVFKRPVVCSSCGEAYLFTLKMIAESNELCCHGCKSSIDLRTSAYSSLVDEVRECARKLKD